MGNSEKNNLIPVDILDDLSSRFIINIPEGERTDPIRLFFQIELAHWFYLDFHRTENPKLRQCGMKEFSKHILRHIPSFSSVLSNLDELFDRWKEYKMSVPTYGAILLNQDMTKVLLVQGYFERISWGFPKGKVNEDEDPEKCAVREVLEETGCDISELIRADVYLETKLMEQMVRLYIVPGVKDTEEFRPLTRNEIKRVKWFEIADLPVNKKDASKLKPNSFFMVLPFIKRLKNWIEKKNEENSPTKRRLRHKSVGDFPSTPLGLPSLYPTSTPRQKRPPDNRSRGAVDEIRENDSPGFKSQRRLFYDGQDPLNFPSWAHFRLDWKPLLSCFD